MSGPLLILVAGGIVAGAAFLLRARPRLSFGLAAGAGALLGAIAIGIVLGAPFQVLGIGVKLEEGWTVLGRSLVLGEHNRLPVGFIFLAGSVLLLSGLASGASRRMPAAGMGVMLALAAALMIQPFVFSPALIASAAIAASVILVRADGLGGRAAARILISYSLAMMVMLLAGWMIEIGGVGAIATAPTRPASILLGLGLAIVIVAPPFHTWLTAAAEEAHPVAFGFTAILLQTAGLVLLLQSLDAFAWMRADPVVMELLRAAGLLMMVLGSIWCLAERRAGRLVAYALLVDFGVSLLAVASGTLEGYAVALAMMVERGLAVMVVALGIATLLDGSDGAEASGPRPISQASFAAAVIGGLCLAGFPLTAGFAGRWSTLAVLGDGDVLAAVATAGTIGIVAYAFGRWGRGVIVGRRVQPAGSGVLRRVLLWSGIGAIIVLGLAPSILFAWGGAVLAGFGGLSLGGIP